MRVPSCYIVRIYRQGFRTLYGVVEDAQSGGVRAFRSAEELLMLLRRQISGTRKIQRHGKSRLTQ